MQMKLRNKLENIRSVFDKKESYAIAFFSCLFIGVVMFYFTYFEATFYNIGAVYAYVQTFLQIALAVLFGINIAMLWYKLKFMSEFASKEANSTTISAVLGVIVSGCPACGITIASYIGLASFFASFPLFGMELKIIGVILILFSINSLAKNLNACEFKVK